ncbi:hypothetical protein AMTRI_Chr03g49620 [Amborella trichopoda]
MLEIPQAPYLLVTKSSDSAEEDLPQERGVAKERAAKLLEGINVKFKGEIKIVEETFALKDNPAPSPKRCYNCLQKVQKEAEELAVGLSFNPLAMGATVTTRRGKGF